MLKTHRSVISTGQRSSAARLRVRTPDMSALFGPPLVLFISIPLAAFAVFTTTIAVVVLAIRVCIVYFELGTALIHAQLHPSHPAPVPAPAPKQPATRHASPNRTRSRRSSTASSHLAMMPQSFSPQLHKRFGSSTSIAGLNDLTRDFEGVGGWRTPIRKDEETLWKNSNARLVLPGRNTTDPDRERHHRRSYTGGHVVSHSQQWGQLRMSQMLIRARTPSYREGEEDPSNSYFSLPRNASVRSSRSAIDLPKKSRERVRRLSNVSNDTPINVATKEAGE